MYLSVLVSTLCAPWISLRADGVCLHSTVPELLIIGGNTMI